MRLLLALSVAALATLLGGCASIVSGQQQSLSVTTTGDAGEVSDARCQLSNNKGTWFVRTPGSTMVQRSYEDLAIRCEHDAYDAGVLAVKSATKPMAFGNILFGGLIGAGVDVSTGAAYDYPPVISVAMGRATGRPPAPAGAAPAAAAASATAAPAAAASATAASGPRGLRAGDQFEYEITDLYTNTARRTRLQVEAVDSRGIVFAGGERIERADGSLAHPGLFNAGDFDSLEPPEGWVRPDAVPGMQWHAEYQARDPLPASRLDLQASVIERSSLVTRAGRFDTLEVVYTGWAQRSSGVMALNHSVRFKLSWAPAIRRVVAFQSEIKPSQLGSQTGRPSRERLQLVGMPALD